MSREDAYTKTARIFMLYDYLRERTSKGHVATKSEINAFFQEREIHISVNTLYADLDTMRDYMGAEVEYDPHLKGYYIKNPPFEPHELRLIIDSVQASKFITGKEAERICGKIRSLTDRHTRQSLNRQAYVADRVRSMNESVVKDADKIHEAIANDRKIGFRYFHYLPGDAKNYSKKGKLYIVSPFLLCWNDGNYYLYAYDGKKFRYFRVDRMEGITRPLLENREGKGEYKGVSQKAKVFGMYAGKEYPVRMRFRNEIADAVIDQFGRDIMMIPVDGEHFTVTVPVQISPPFFAWVASLGRRAKILSPAAVVEEMRDFLEKASDMYKEDGNA